MFVDYKKDSNEVILILGNKELKQIMRNDEPFVFNINQYDEDVKVSIKDLNFVFMSEWTYRKLAYLQKLKKENEEIEKQKSIESNDNTTQL